MAPSWRRCVTGCASRRTDGTASPMATMRERLYAYLELDAYLTDQGIART